MSEPLREAEQLQASAAETGFDWPRDAESQAQLWAKLQEEIGELRDASDRASRAEELGDLLFMVVNIARHLHLDPTAALSAANRKFSRRFAHILEHADALPPLGDPQRLAGMERLWAAAKRLERSTPSG